MEIPIFRAVPSTIFIALSILFVFKSNNLVLAISFNWLRVIEPTLTRFGVDDPFLICAALISKTEAGGVLRIKKPKCLVSRYINYF